MMRGAFALSALTLVLNKLYSVTVYDQMIKG